MPQRALLLMSALARRPLTDRSIALKKTASGPKGFFSFYAGFGVSLGGIIPHRGFQLGAFDTHRGIEPVEE